MHRPFAHRIETLYGASLVNAIKVKKTARCIGERGDWQSRHQGKCRIDGSNPVHMEIAQLNPVTPAPMKAVILEGIKDLGRSGRRRC